MKSIRFTTGELKEEKTSVWLVSCLKYANKVSAFKAFNKVQVNPKQRNYSVINKLTTIVCSVATGCKYTSRANARKLSVCSNSIRNFLKKEINFILKAVLWLGWKAL